MKNTFCTWIHLSPLTHNKLTNSITHWQKR